MSQELSDAELLERLTDAVNRQPRRRREMFLLCRVEGWTFQQIADAYGVSRSRVQREIARALHDVTLEVIEGSRPRFWHRWF